MGILNQQHKILIVDDDYDLRSELKDMLEDYAVVEASSGEQAIDLLKRANDIDLVILDVIMSRLNGIDVLTHLKKTDPDLGVIILTGHSSKDMAIEALKARADDFIEKPICIDKIKESIERLLGAKKAKGFIEEPGLKGKLAKVKNFIEVNVYKKTNLDDAAKLVCLSPKYLSRVFKEYYKIGFSEHKIRSKINKAKVLLEKTFLNTNQISDKLAYENAESFIRQFKKITRRTPSAYRKAISRSKKASRK